MDFQKIYQIIINEPIYLAITIILLSIIAFSILKKLFKMMVTILIILVFYVGYLMYTGQDLPSEENINAIKEKVVKGVEQGINQLDKMSKENN
jgi:amino acid permease|tara:strand:+ start:280 stop:558 length:279 start_codon:yes stop_codon:yes gene_type:complete